MAHLHVSQIVEYTLYIIRSSDGSAWISAADSQMRLSAGSDKRPHQRCLFSYQKNYLEKIRPPPVYR